MGESNNVVSAYTLYRHLQQYCSHLSIYYCLFSSFQIIDSLQMPQQYFQRFDNTRVGFWPMYSLISLPNYKILALTILQAFSLNIFILHRLRKKFLQLILISLDSASCELHQYSRRMCGPMRNPKVETRSRDSNSGPHDCKADALPQDHGHHTGSICTKLKAFAEDKFTDA